MIVICAGIVPLFKYKKIYYLFIVRKMKHKFEHGTIFAYNNVRKAVIFVPL